jgi:hypothetical protein
MARLEPQFRSPDELSIEDIEAMVAIARKHAALKDELRAALLAGDDARALAVARKLVGLPPQSPSS